MATKHGVVYNLLNSPFKCSWGKYTFYFSSATHLAKFNEKLDARIEWLNDSFSRRFHVNIDVSVLAVMQLYMQLETRGFYIIDSAASEEFKCRENITLHGMTISGSDLTVQ